MATIPYIAPLLYYPQIDYKNIYKPLGLYASVYNILFVHSARLLCITPLVIWDREDYSTYDKKKEIGTLYIYVCHNFSYCV